MCRLRLQWHRRQKQFQSLCRLRRLRLRPYQCLLPLRLCRLRRLRLRLSRLCRLLLRLCRLRLLHPHLSRLRLSRLSRPRLLRQSLLFLR